MAILEAIFGFVLIGITLEIFWTSIINSIKVSDLKLTGKTYLWMFPVYAIVPLIYILILPNFNHTNIFFRGIIYMLAFYLLEFISGWLIKKLVKVSPWNYEGYSINIFGKKYKSNLNGLICLEYAPIWFLYGILGEFYFKFLIAL
jgi:hypothetical protein